MDMDSKHYSPPLALTVLSAIFLILGAICFLVIVVDIIVRKGWRSMMGIMIPVYPINAAYMLPVTLYTYFKFGRPADPTSNSGKACHESGEAKPCHGNSTEPSSKPVDAQTSDASRHCKSHQPASCHQQVEPTASEQSSISAAEKGQANSDDACCHDTSRPMWATVLVGVSHCGAGCVLGDLVGEWLVYGTGATINGKSIWVELLVDYAFALLFGVAFQYFSIAPMSGEYGLKTVWRAAKADVLSLTSFEAGAFGWMIIYQVGIFDYRLEMTTWTYWWMMQIGMVFGFATAYPANWFLLKWGIKEPCC